MGTASVKGTRFMISLVAVQPIVALLVGILVLILPRMLNYLIALYLIFMTKPAREWFES